MFWCPTPSGCCRRNELPCGPGARRLKCPAPLLVNASRAGRPGPHGTPRTSVASEGIVACCAVGVHMACPATESGSTRGLAWLAGCPLGLGPRVELPSETPRDRAHGGATRRGFPGHGATTVARQGFSSQPGPKRSICQATYSRRRSTIPGRMRRALVPAMRSPRNGPSKLVGSCSVGRASSNSCLV